MGAIPEDPHERRRWLERWANEKAERIGAPPERLRQRVAKLIERQLEQRSSLLDPILDRGLNTSGNELVPKPDEEGSDIYVAGPTPWHVLPRALRKVKASENDVFVEFGCGKGRVLHQAAMRPLKRVIGVEIVPEVANMARSLVAAQRRKYRCRTVEIATCDAARFPVPDDLTIAYHAYGFQADTMDTVLSNLIASIDRRPRRVHLIYYRPSRLGAEVLATRRFRLLADLSFGEVAIFESREES